MIKKIFILLMIVFSVNGAKYHQDSKGVEIHTPFRWVVANSTARVALTVTAQDTQKLCFQIADTTIWMLSDNSPKRWTWVSGKEVDSLYVSGGLRGLRLYMQTASVDTFKKGFVVKGMVSGVSPSASNCPFTSYGSKNKINGLFGTLSNNDGGVICYDSSGSARIQLRTRGSGYILGSIAINQTTPDSTLTVGGSAHVTGNARIDGSLKVQSCSTTTLEVNGTVTATGTVAAPSLQLGTGDLLSVYDTGSFACSLFDNATYRAVVTARYTIIGNVVNLSIPSVTGTMSGVTTTFLGTIPTVIRPNRSALIGTTVILNNGALESGRIMYVTGTPERFRIYKLSSSSLDAGDGGINDGFTGNYKFSYTLD